MTRVKSYKFFSLYNIECTSEVIEKYNNGWTLSELKAGKQFISEAYEDEVKAFKQNIK
jgi:hypothetical protein